MALAHDFAVRSRSSTNRCVGASSGDGLAAFSGFVGIHIAARLLQICWMWAN
jgi:hypothetical protein